MVDGVTGSIASASTSLVVRPALIGDQLAPPVVLLYTPPSSVPAYTVAGVTGSTASTRTVPPFGPSGVHVPASADPAPARTAAAINGTRTDRPIVMDPPDHAWRRASRRYPARRRAVNAKVTAIVGAILLVDAEPQR